MISMSTRFEAKLQDFNERRIDLSGKMDTYSSLEVGRSPGVCFELFGADVAFTVEASAAPLAGTASPVGVLATTVGAASEGLEPTVFEVVFVWIFFFGVGITISRSLHLQLRFPPSVLYCRRYE